MPQQHFFQRNSAHRQNRGAFWRLATATVLAVLSSAVLLPGGDFAEAGSGAKLLALAIFVPAFASLVAGLILRAAPPREDDIV